MPILNYTTSIDAYKSVGEIQQILAKAGAVRTVIENDREGNPIALTFGYAIKGVEYSFRLPCNFAGIQASLEKKRVEPRYKTKSQCIRIGWRIIKDWVEAQMALVEAQVATPLQVFLPYANTRHGNTVYEMLTGPGDTLLLTN